MRISYFHPVILIFTIFLGKIYVDNGVGNQFVGYHFKNQLLRKPFFKKPLFNLFDKIPDTN